VSPGAGEVATAQSSTGRYDLRSMIAAIMAGRKVASESLNRIIDRISRIVAWYIAHRGRHVAPTRHGRHQYISDSTLWLIRLIRAGIEAV